MALHDKITLKPGEKILLVVRRFPLTQLWWYVLGFGLLFIAFFFLFVLFALGIGGALAFTVLLVLAFYILGRTVFLWYYNAFIITNLRVIDFDQRNFFDRIVSESSYEKIQDVSFRYRGFFETLFRFGTVNVQTAWGSVNLTIPEVHHPELVQRLLLDVHADYLGDTESGASRQSLVDVATRLKDLKPEELAKLREAVEEAIAGARSVGHMERAGGK